MKNQDAGETYEALEKYLKSIGVELTADIKCIFKLWESSKEKKTFNSIEELYQAICKDISDILKQKKEIPISTDLRIDIIKYFEHGKDISEIPKIIIGDMKNMSVSEIKDKFITFAEIDGRPKTMIDLIKVIIKKYLNDKEETVRAYGSVLRLYKIWRNMIFSVKTEVDPHEFKTKFAKHLRESKKEPNINKNKIWDVFISDFSLYKRLFGLEDIKFLYTTVVNRIKEDAGETKAKKEDFSKQGIYHHLPYDPEHHTRIGFEIELAKMYNFTKGNYEQVNSFTNETLATFYLNKDLVEGKDMNPDTATTLENAYPVLEMLLDDVKQEEAVTAQLEFRSRPLNFEYIHKKLGDGIQEAIEGFDSFILKARDASKKWISKNGNYYRKGDTSKEWGISKKGDVYKEVKNEKGVVIGFWVQKKPLPPNVKYTPPKIKKGNKYLPQHATISIEPEAFIKLLPSQKKKLVPYLQDCTTRKEFINKLSTHLEKKPTKMSIGLGMTESVINASTQGRNKAEVCYKTPLEAILAADSNFDPQDIATTLKRVTIEREKYTYSLQEINDVVKEIRRINKFPKIQGENNIGSGEVLDEKEFIKRIKGEFLEKYKIEKTSNRDQKWLKWKLKQHRIGYRVRSEKLQPLLLDEFSGIPRILFEHRAQETGSLVDTLKKALGTELKMLEKDFKELRDAAKAMDDSRTPK